MEYADLKQDEIIKSWLKQINVRETTLNNYLMGMRHFTEFTKMSPEQLLEIAEDEQDENLKLRKRFVNIKLPSFRNYLQGKNEGGKENGLKLAPLTIKAYLTGVKSFYNSFDIELKKVELDDTKLLQENKAIPTISDIREILKTCDPLETALVLCGCCSGMDGNTLCNLTVKDFTKGYDKITGITTLSLRRLKTGEDFITFLTPEASEAVLNYLSFRARTIDTVDKHRSAQLEKQKVRNDEGYLFVLKRISNKYLEDYDEARRQIKRPALMKIYRDISTKANMNTKKGQFNFIRSHNFRKFFDSTMLNNGCDFFHCEEFMGHALPGTQKHYFTPNIEELKTYYSQFIPYLTINKQISIADSKDFKNAVAERDHYKALAQKYLVDNVELLNAKGELAAMKFKTLNPEQQKQELIKSVSEIQPVMSPNPTEKERENADYMIKMRDTVLQILRDK